MKNFNTISIDAVKRLMIILENDLNSEESSLADADEEELPWDTAPDISNVSNIDDIDWTNTCDNRIVPQTYRTNSCQELNNAIIRFQQLYNVFLNPQGYRCKYQCQQSIDSVIRQQLSSRDRRLGRPWMCKTPSDIFFSVLPILTLYRSHITLKWINRESLPSFGEARSA